MMKTAAPVGNRNSRRPASIPLIHQPKWRKWHHKYCVNGETYLQQLLQLVTRC